LLQKIKISRVFMIICGRQKGNFALTNPVGVCNDGTFMGLPENFFQEAAVFIFPSSSPDRIDPFFEPARKAGGASRPSAGRRQNPSKKEIGQ